MLMEAQGYLIRENNFEQDNKSAIRLERNSGRASDGPKSRHVDIRYFWIKDRIKLHDIKIRHCPTLKMLADFFTKPLQGALFTKFRDVVLGYKHVDTLDLDPAPEPEERVGEKRSTSDGTDGPSADSTVIVKDCTQSDERITWADVVKRPKGAQQPAYNRKDILRAHSLETIPLVK